MTVVSTGDPVTEVGVDELVDEAERRVGVELEPLHPAANSAPVKPSVS